MAGCGGCLVHDLDRNGVRDGHGQRAYEAKTHLPGLLRAAERGETVIITRHGKPVAQIEPVDKRRGEGVARVIERIKRVRALRPRVTVEEILSARDDGGKA